MPITMILSTRWTFLKFVAVDKKGLIYMKERIQYNTCTRCQVQYVQLKYIYIDISFMLLTVLWQKEASSFWMWAIEINNYVSSTHIDIIRCFDSFTKTTGKYWTQKTVNGTNRDRLTKAEFSLQKARIES